MNKVLKAADEADARWSPPELSTIEIACKNERLFCARVVESFVQDYPDLADILNHIARVIRRERQ